MTAWSETVDIVPKFLGGGFLTWLATYVVNRGKTRHDDLKKLAAIEAGTAQHNDKLLVEMVRIAQAELATFRAEVASSRNSESDLYARIRPLEIAKTRLCEAMEHFLAIKTAQVSGDTLLLAASIRRGWAFYQRCIGSDPTLMPTVPDDLADLAKRADGKS